MKKVLFALIAIAFASCSSSDDDNGAERAANRLMGEWTKADSFDGSSATFSICPDEYYFFESDGMKLLEIVEHDDFCSAIEYSTEWKTTGSNKLKVKSAGEWISADLHFVNDDIVQLTMREAGATFVYTYVRQ